MANSFKQMIKSGQIKRPDSGMFISIDDIHVKPGFNKREDDDRTRQADDDLFHFLMNGGMVPPSKFLSVMKVESGLLKAIVAIVAICDAVQQESQLTDCT
jgi:hypothetical protein